MGPQDLKSFQPKSPSVPLFSRELGGAGAPPVVILHGMLGSSRNWQTAGGHMAQGRRVFALDLRNHGQSPHADTMSYAEMAGDVVAWMDARGFSRVDLVGHSMGGKVAMVLACVHPQRVGHLVVIDIAPKDYHWRARRDEFAAMNALELGDLKSRAEAEIRLEGRVPGWAMRKFLVTNLERTPGDGWRWQVNLPVLTHCLDSLESNPLAKSDRFLGPTLFAIGEKSTYVGPDDRGAILDHFPSAHLVTLAGSGHNPHIEAREALVGAVLAELGTPL